MTTVAEPHAPTPSHDLGVPLVPQGALLTCLDAELRSGADVHPLVVIELRLDWFEDVDATVSPQTAEHALHEVTRRLCECTDLAAIARSHADGFVAYARLPRDGGARDAELLVARWLESLEANLDVDGESVPVHGSAGVALAPRSHDAEAPGAGELTRRARVALHRAQAQRTGIAFYEPGADRRAEQRMSQVLNLKHAISSDELRVHYQPVVELATGRVVSLEALVRWEDPARGFVPPAAFLPLAEEYDVIGSLTAVVLEQVVEQSRTFATHGLALPCTINLSLRCLTHPRRSGQLVSRLAEAAGAVGVEVTEEIAADERALQALRRLSGNGVRCTIDDFGVGCDRLRPLPDLPVDAVKLDSVLVRDMGSDPRALLLVRTVAELAEVLELDVVGGRVEDEATATVLKQAGVRHAQGYHFAKPMPADRLTALLVPQPHTPPGPT